LKYSISERHQIEREREREGEKEREVKTGKFTEIFGTRVSLNKIFLAARSR
jgi:hypothetical protein